MSPQPAPSRVHPVAVPLVLANVGVLVTLFFGPNGEHASMPVALAGGALALAGVGLMLRAILARRRQEEAAAERRR